MTAVRRREVTARGLSLVAHEVGPPDGPVVVAMHGFLDSGLSFRSVAAALADEHRVLMLDFRGHGHSGWIGDGGSYYFPDYYADVDEVLEGLGLESFFVLAHSMGGSVAIGTAARVPARVRAMVLLEGMGPPAEEPDSAPARLARFVTALRREDVRGPAAARRAARRPMADVAEAADRMRRVNPRLDAARALELATDAVEPAPGGVVWRFDPLHRTPSARPFRADEFGHLLPEITAPVLSLFGAESEWGMGELVERHRRLRAARFALVPGAAHNVHHDRPALVAAAARAWFRAGMAAELPGELVETGPGLGR